MIVLLVADSSTGNMWISFINDLNPNHHGLYSYDGHAVPEWPVYAINASDPALGYGTNLVFDDSLPGLAVQAADDYRGAQIAYLLEHSVELFGT